MVSYRPLRRAQLLERNVRDTTDVTLTNKARCIKLEHRLDFVLYSLETAKACFSNFIVDAELLAATVLRPASLSNLLVFMNINSS